MEQKQGQFQCTGNCLLCQPAQRAYCASQHAYSNMKVLDTMMSAVLALQEDVKSISEKIEAMQSNEASIFDPHVEYEDEEIQENEENIAQKGQRRK